ncbi:MAG: glycosyltransferase family 2 protein [Acidobacteria bacterium]|nr:glycosyltransferase family 2 protein [Acidobacteriota bacterium]
MDTRDPLVSVVIPSYNEGTWVERTVRETLAHDDGHPIEAIVVDDGSTDGSCDFLELAANTDSRARLIRQDQLGLRRARNAGAAASRGEHLVFLDAHVVPESGWLTEMLRVLSDPSVALAGCRIGDITTHAVSHQSYTFVNENFRNGWAPRCDEKEPSESPCIPGGCVAVRRSTFQAIGGWDSGGAKWGVDDVELSMRAWRLGYRCIMSPAATVWHWYRESSDRPAAVAWVDYDVNVLRCLLLHFTGRRLNAILHGLKQRPNFAQSWHNLQQDTAYGAWCSDLQSRFTRTEEWYFRKFSTELEVFEQRIEELLEDKERQQRETEKMLRERSAARSTRS